MKRCLAIAACAAILQGCFNDPESARGFRLPAGDAERGKLAFEDLQCGACHSVRGKDEPAESMADTRIALGGDVTRVKTYGELVTSIINPSHKIASGHGDVPMAVEAMQKGAFDFIQKPFRDQDLLERVSDALSVDQRRRTTDAKRAEVSARLEKLTKREQEVMQLVVRGKPNKVIAFDLGVSQRTVEIHRARVMEKIQARSLADLVRMSLDVTSEND